MGKVKRVHCTECSNNRTTLGAFLKHADNIKYIHEDKPGYKTRISGEYRCNRCKTITNHEKTIWDRQK